MFYVLNVIEACSELMNKLNIVEVGEFKAAA